MQNYDFGKIANSVINGAVLTRAARLEGGVSADVFRLDLEHPVGHAQQVVLRVHGETHGGHSAALEYTLLQAVRAQGLPVPEALFVDSGGDLLGFPAVVIAFVEGQSGVPDELGEDCVLPMARMLKRIHQPVPRDFPELPARLNPLPELFEFFPEEPEWAELATYLRGLDVADYTGQLCLLHGDFWPENILWQNAEIAAVLDWEDAAVGDPLSDLASARVELRYLFGKSVMDRFAQAYAGTTELDLERLALWQIYVAAAADRYMGQWRLPPERESRMRREARASISEAGSYLLGISDQL